jgi:hypothetical protein
LVNVYLFLRQPPKNGRVLHNWQLIITFGHFYREDKYSVIKRKSNPAGDKQANQNI